MDNTPGLSIFQNGSINVEAAMENLEEAEDLEDQKRRQEEIQNLLKKAMDEFNYDDQSTLNSSTNISLNECEEKYKNASMNDQIKVLYDVRVREVKTLQQKVDELQNALTEQKSSSAKKLILTEAEKERAFISLQQAQELLVTKNEEINKLTRDLGILRDNLEKAECNINSVNKEVESLRLTNGDLLQQLLIMKQGFNTNTITERQMQENLNAEINSLQYSLDMALKSLDRKEEEVSCLQQKLSNEKSEKDKVVSEKNEVINKLKGSIENSQHQYVELLQVVELLTQENKELKASKNDLNLANTLGIGLTDKTEIIKVLQKELEKANSVQMKHLSDYEELLQENSDLNKRYSLLENNLDHFKIENKLLQANLQSCESNLKSKQDEIKFNQLTINQCGKLELENKELLSKIKHFEEVITSVKKNNCNYKETSMQTSQNLNSFCTQTNESLYLDVHKSEIETLKSQNIIYEKEINELKLKISLEQEREQLIQDLQQKALLFEEVIQENKKPKITTGTNTEDNTQENTSLNELLFETKLIEKEIELRVQIEKEFAGKLKHCPNCIGLANQIKQFNAILDNKKKEIATLQKSTRDLIEFNKYSDSYCAQLSEQLKNTDLKLQNEKSSFMKIKSQQLKDREILVKVLDEWRIKFKELELQNQQLINNLTIYQGETACLQKKLKILEKGDTDLVQELQKETEKLLKDWNMQAFLGVYNLTASHYNKVIESGKKIESISKRTDRKIKLIEEKFLKSKETIIKNFKY